MDCDQLRDLTPLYLSGELDESRAAAFRGHLASCPSCDLDARLRHEILSDDVDTTALDARILAAVKSAPRRRVSVSIAASIAAVLVIGVIAYRVSTAASPLFAAAALDHHREVIDHQRRSWISDPAAVEALAEREGIGPELVSALAPAGYHCDRAKVCRLGAVSFLHLVYSDGAREFSIFLRHRDAALSDRIEHADLGPDHVAALRTPHLDAVVVTDESSEAALQFARTAAHIL